MTTADEAALQEITEQVAQEAEGLSQGLAVAELEALVSVLRQLGQRLKQTLS